MSTASVIYARVSTIEQGDNYSLPTQLDACRKYAAEHNYQVAGEFTDSFTGTEMDRPGFSKLKDFVYQHKVKAVIVYDIDRFSRVFNDRAVLEVEIEDLGARVEYVIGNYDGSPEGDLTKHIKSAIAEYEVRQRSERVRRGRQGKLRAGYVMMSHLRTPYGYSYVSEPHKGRLEIEETEAQVVRQIYAWLLEGNSCYTIAKMLSDQGVPTRGDQRDGVIKEAQYGVWAPVTVTKMVRNPAYKGEWTYGKTKRVKEKGKVRYVPTSASEQIVVETPAIVDAQTWEQAQHCLTRNKANAKRNTKREYLLRGLITCACGRRWLGVYKSHLGRGYYRCQQLESRKWVGPQCTVTGGVRQETLEEAVWEKVCTVLLDENCLRTELAGRRTTVSAELQGRRRRLEATQKVLADVQRKIDYLLSELLSGGFSADDLKPHKERLLEQRRSLQADVARLEAEISQAELSPEQEETVLDYARRVRQGIEQLTGQERRRILELLAVNVEVIDQEHFRVTALFPIAADEISLPRAPQSRKAKAAATAAPEVTTVRSVNTLSI
jgi:site-specific DNA recombinase